MINQEKIKSKINDLILDNYASTFEEVIDKIIAKDGIVVYDEGDIDKFTFDLFMKKHIKTNFNDINSYNRAYSLYLKIITKAKEIDDDFELVLETNSNDFNSLIKEIKYLSNGKIDDYWYIDIFYSLREIYQYTINTFYVINKHKEGIFITPLKILLVKDKKDYHILAHEIAHWYLHSHDKIYTYAVIEKGNRILDIELLNEDITIGLSVIFDNNIIKNYPFGDTKQEKAEADFFALHLIMHDSIFIEKYYEYTDKIHEGNYTSIAKFFNVSLKDAKKRVLDYQKELGIR